MSVVKGTVLGLTEIATGEVAVALELQSLDVYTCFPIFLFRNARRQRTRVEIPFDEGFLRLLLPVQF